MIDLSVIVAYFLLGMTSVVYFIFVFASIFTNVFDEDEKKQSKDSDADSAESFYVKMYLQQTKSDTEFKQNLT